MTTLFEPVSPLSLKDEEDDANEEGLANRRFICGDQKVIVDYLAVYRGTILDVTKGVDLTGQMVWPATSAICRFVVAYSSFFSNKNIIELGAGVGLCGLMAAKFAKHVVLTDKDEGSLELLKKNISLNTALNESAVFQVEWGKSLEPLLSEFSAFDIIIASDVIYPDREPVVIALFKTVKDLIVASGPNTVFVVGYVPREANTTKFWKEVAASLHFEITLVPWNYYSNVEPVLGSEIYVLKLINN